MAFSELIIRRLPYTEIDDGVEVRFGGEFGSDHTGTGGKMRLILELMPLGKLDCSSPNSFM